MPTLFDVNARFGCGARLAPDFPRAADLLAHMDYLGIDRALTYHAAARDSDGPFFGNRELLREIQSEPRAARRLVPAFAVEATDYYRDGAVDFYAEHLRSGRVRALRVFTYLPHVQSLIAPLAQYRPVVLFSFQDSVAAQTEADAIVKLAREFQEVSVICTNVMWTQYSLLLDSMRKSPNILVDTSWLHVRDSIPLLVKHFGAERVVFGIGPKSHYGAAVAALAHAGIGEHDRELIAHGNLERLLGMDRLTQPLAAAPPPVLAEKPIWASFRRGQPVKDVPVIDAHGHSGSGMPGWYLADDMRFINGKLIDHMDTSGVRHMVVSSTAALMCDPVAGNRALAEDLSQHPDRFSGYLSCNPHYRDALAPLLDEFFAGTFFVGFKLHPDCWQVPLGDPRYEYVWEYADRHALPILLHTWNGSTSSPRMLADIVKKYPRALFLLGHSGGGDAGRREAVDLVLASSNVMLEFCGSFTSSIPWDDTIARVGAHRVLFGSDTFGHDLPWELGRLLSTPLPDSRLAPILGANMQEILDKGKK